MSKKLKFKPIITRVKLNPEQAVLACTCSSSRHGRWALTTFEADPVAHWQFSCFTFGKGNALIANTSVFAIAFWGYKPHRVSTAHTTIST